jgi:hypothetical protein
MPGEVQKFERHASITQQRRLALQFKRKAWLGPPSDVWVGRILEAHLLTTLLDNLRRNFQQIR